MAETICYIAGEFPKRSETFVYREVRALRRRGWIVRAVSLNRPADGDLAEFADLCDGLRMVYGHHALRTMGHALAEVLWRPVRVLRTLRAALRDARDPGEAMSGMGRVKLIAQAAAGIGLARRLRRRGVRHIHCHFAHAPTTIGMYAAMQMGVGFSFTGHANDLFQRRALLKRKLERAAFVACISEWHREFYRAIHWRDDDAYVLVRCGVDVTAWQPRESPNGQVDRELQLLTVCRLVEKKGVDMLIRGARAMQRETGRPWRLTIAGDGPDREKLSNLANELGCRGSVQFIGAVENERVRQLLGQTDLLALPCRTDARGDRDGIPVVLMEAMACGVPVISGDLPAIRELIEHDVSGLLVDGTSEKEITGALKRLADGVEERRRLGRGGRARVEEEFALEMNVERLEQALRRAMQ